VLDDDAIRVLRELRAGHVDAIAQIDLALAREEGSTQPAAPSAPAGWLRLCQYAADAKVVGSTAWRRAHKLEKRGLAMKIGGSWFVSPMALTLPTI
jgi:hypothetical protein